MTVRRHVTAVRPYQFEDDIRVRMFAHLESAGLELATRHIIPPGTADDIRRHVEDWPSVL